jgi:hypothetical protein
MCRSQNMSKWILSSSWHTLYVPYGVWKKHKDKTRLSEGAKGHRRARYCERRASCGSAPIEWPGAQRVRFLATVSSADCKICFEQRSTIVFPPNAVIYSRNVHTQISELCAFFLWRNMFLVKNICAQQNRHIKHTEYSYKTTKKMEE